jgi:hypothetical protein
MPEHYQKEIEEILKKAEMEGPGPRKHGVKPGFGRTLWLQARQSFGGRGWSISPGRIMLTAGLLLLAWLVLKSYTPVLASSLAWAGLLVFIIGYALFFVRPPRGGEKRWRGQPLDDRSHSPFESWWERIRRRMK